MSSLDKRTFQFLQLGLAILVMSSSGTLGRFVGIPPEQTIWARCVVGAIVLFAYLKFSNTPTYLGWGRSFRTVSISALFLGVHWVTYFYALKYTSVAIGMLSLFTYPVITAVLEPYILGYKHKLADVLVALLAFTGVFFLVPAYTFGNQVTLGIAFGVVSAILYSVRNILLKKDIGEHSGITLMYYQLAILSIVMFPVIYLGDVGSNLHGIGGNWQPLLILGVLTTAVGHTLFVSSFRYFSITTISIISSLTPLFGIGLGLLFLGEIPQPKVLIGGGIILSSVIVESIRSTKR
ncbi:Threonine/homoserine efflux transporter RhtA [Reichenbachiella agariperforans]|uniref:Threonine/homoserine efflux transporter RhtA n=1 Tax=Reichenbachiella agariperforans TaxID=156994 RepID=A0A1M6QII2_REIAG|nr:Threonine/homoserine efflux transporter RhtA [Reichenbachiella agariperforans]